MATKEALRNEFRQRLSAWTARDNASTNTMCGGRFAAEQTISRHLVDVIVDFTSKRQTTPLSSPGPRWGAFKALPGEPNPQTAIRSLSSKVSWAFPRIDGSQLRFYAAVHDDEACFNDGLFGLSEPDPSTCEEVQVRDLAGMLIPGVAFDGKGTRLGRGKGYFDRALVGYLGLKIGVAFAVQLYENELPADLHDVPMDVVVSERGVLCIAETERINNS